MSVCLRVCIAGRCSQSPWLVLPHVVDLSCYTAQASHPNCNHLLEQGVQGICISGVREREFHPMGCTSNGCHQRKSLIIFTKHKRHHMHIWDDWHMSGHIQWSHTSGTHLSCVHLLVPQYRPGSLRSDERCCWSRQSRPRHLHPQEHTPGCLGRYSVSSSSLYSVCYQVFVIKHSGSSGLLNVKRVTGRVGE